MSKKKSEEVRPLYDRIVVKETISENVSESGIFLGESESDGWRRGEILEVGHGRVSESGKMKPLSVEVGDKIIFGSNVGVEIKVNGQDLLMMNEDDVVAIEE